jgi:hypothetical protein
LSYDVRKHPAVFCHFLQAAEKRFFEDLLNFYSLAYVLSLKREPMKAVSEKVESIEKREAAWPELILEEWKETYTTLHLWSQIVGKVKLEFAPFINHWWNVTFLPSASGLTTGIIPYGDRSFEMEFDFISHQLNIKTNEGKRASVPLKSGTIADFYGEIKEKLKSLGIEIHIWPVPVEIDDRLPFDQDYRSGTYNASYANRFWQVMVQASKAMTAFRSGFTGKASPVHFFWGSMDFAVTLFSGKSAPEHPGAPNVGRKVMVEAYNAELASFGFWGGKGLGEAAFYAYTYPEPGHYRHSRIKPKEAYYNEAFREFILPYAVVRQAAFPEKMIMDFYQGAFDATGWRKEDVNYDLLVGN